MQPPAGQSGGSNIQLVFMIGLCGLIFYFMILRPQQKRQKERKSVLDGLQKGDKIITIGGCHGVVVGIDEKTILVQVAENVKLKFERTAIGSIIREGETILAEKAQ
jgi:preprotein translocase subunit YajC